jgi:hypothetical protein
MTLEEYFEGYEESRHLFATVRVAIERIGPAAMKVSKSQVSFRRRKAFAWVWMPARYLGGKGAPLVLTLTFAYRDSSPRWKEIVEPQPDHFTHHLELYAASDVDEEVQAWLWKAWEAAA